MNDTQDAVYHLLADRKGEVTSRAFHRLEDAKRAAEDIWRSWEWWHGSSKPLVWEADDESTVPINEDYTDTDEAMIVIERLTIE